MIKMSEKLIPSGNGCLIGFDGSETGKWIKCIYLGNGQFKQIIEEYDHEKETQTEYD